MSRLRPRPTKTNHEIANRENVHHEIATYETADHEAAARMSLFAKLEPEDGRAAAAQPLAERMRPRALDEFTGQETLLGPGKPLRTQIERDDIGSMILWGPPGCGKTTLARLIARRS